jgi:hypothetical protein
MKCSRVLVAVLAVLCLASMSNAAIITLQPTQVGNHGAYGIYANGVTNVGGGKQLYLKYDLSSIQASIDAGNVIVSAKLVYQRDSASFVAQGGAEVVQATIDPTTDTSGSSANAIHAALINNATEVMQGINLTFSSEVVTDLGWKGTSLEGGYGGAQSVDVLAIVNSWLGGAANYGLGFDTIYAGYTTNLSQHHLYNYVTTSSIPYLEIEMAPAPEPMTIGLLAIGGIATLLRRRRIA